MMKMHELMEASYTVNSGETFDLVANCYSYFIILCDSSLLCCCC